LHEIGIKHWRFVHEFGTEYCPFLHEFRGEFRHKATACPATTRFPDELRAPAAQLLFFRKTPAPRKLFL